MVVYSYVCVGCVSCCLFCVLIWADFLCAIAALSCGVYCDVVTWFCFWFGMCLCICDYLFWLKLFCLLWCVIVLIVLDCYVLLDVNVWVLGCCFSICLLGLLNSVVIICFIVLGVAVCLFIGFVWRICLCLLFVSSLHCVVECLVGCLILLYVVWVLLLWFAWIDWFSGLMCLLIVIYVGVFVFYGLLLFIVLIYRFDYGEYLVCGFVIRVICLGYCGLLTCLKLVACILWWLFVCSMLACGYWIMLGFWVVAHINRC